MAINVTPNSVSTRVVKVLISKKLSADSADFLALICEICVICGLVLKTTSVPSERPIQLRCIVLIFSGQFTVSRSASSRSAYSVILKYHWASSFLVTSLSQRQHLPCSTCSLARMVWQVGHHHWLPSAR